MDMDRGEGISMAEMDFSRCLCGKKHGYPYCNIDYLRRDNSPFAVAWYRFGLDHVPFFDTHEGFSSNIGRTATSIESVALFADIMMSPQDCDSEDAQLQIPMGTTSLNTTCNSIRVSRALSLPSPDRATTEVITRPLGLDTMDLDNDNNTGHGGMTSSHTSHHVQASTIEKSSNSPDAAAAVYNEVEHGEPQAQMDNERDAPQTVEESVGPSLISHAQPAPETQVADTDGALQLMPPPGIFDGDCYPLTPHGQLYDPPPQGFGGYAGLLGSTMPDGILHQNGDYGHMQYNDEDLGDGQHEEKIAFARLEFPDNYYYVSTFAVKLGRDLAAERQRRPRKRSGASREPQTPMQRNSDKMSESGGLLRYGDDTDSDERQSRRKRRKTKSTGSASLHRSRRNTPVVQESRIRDFSPAPDQDTKPSPWMVPLLPLHSGDGRLKSISREHAKIEFNPNNQLWELKILGTNGAFVDDHLHPKHATVPLASGARIQIGGVEFRFVLPERLEEGSVEEEYSSNAGDRYSQGGKEMSMDFGSPHDKSLMDNTSDDGSGDERLAVSGMAEDTGADEQDEHEDEDEDDGDDDDHNDDDDRGRRRKRAVEETGDDEPERVEPEPKPQKKRGPGRPPKNGVMSKREQQEAKKAAQQKAKKSTTENSGSVKNKAGRKNSSDSTPPIKTEKTEKIEKTEKTEKRKYTKRKPKDLGSSAVKEGESAEEKPAKEKKEKKSARQDRSPSPKTQMKVTDFTEEQLAKPAANYVTLIHEALTNNKDTKPGGMSLPEIYRAMQRRHPYFLFRTTTTGWQSSVRHNLGQHAAFTRVGKEKDGKGHVWQLVPGVSIEKDKKQRHMSPPQPGSGPMFPQAPYQAGPPHQMANGSMHVQGMMGSHGLPNQYNQGPPPIQYPYPPHGSVPPQGSHHRPYMGPMTQPQLIPPQSSSYSSPYGNPNPPVPPPPQQATGQIQQYGVPNGFAPPPQPPPQMHPHPQHRPPPQQPVPNTSFDIRFLQAVDLFKTRLIEGLQQKKADKPEVIVESAVNRVLGQSKSAIFENPHEETIVGVFQNFINTLNSSLNPQPSPTQNPSSPMANVQGIGPTQAPRISRPSLGPARPNTVPRPPMMMAGGALRNVPSNLATMSPQLPPTTASPSSASSSTLPTSPAPNVALPGLSAPANSTNVANSLPLGGITNLSTAPAVMSPNTNLEPHVASLKRPLEVENDHLNDQKRIKTEVQTNEQSPSNPDSLAGTPAQVKAEVPKPEEKPEAA